MSKRSFKQYENENKDETETHNKRQKLAEVNVVKQLSTLVAKKEQTHHFTVGSSATLPLVSGLHIHNIGAVPLPICVQQV